MFFSLSFLSSNKTGQKRFNDRIVFGVHQSVQWSFRDSDFHLRHISKFRLESFSQWVIDHRSFYSIIGSLRFDDLCWSIWTKGEMSFQLKLSFEAFFQSLKILFFQDSDDALNSWHFNLSHSPSDLFLSQFVRLRNDASSVVAAGDKLIACYLSSITRHRLTSLYHPHRAAAEQGTKIITFESLEVFSTFCFIFCRRSEMWRAQYAWLQFTRLPSSSSRCFDTFDDFNRINYAMNYFCSFTRRWWKCLSFTRACGFSRLFAFSVRSLQSSSFRKPKEKV